MINICIIGEPLPQNDWFLKVDKDGKVLATKSVDKEDYESSFTIFEVSLKSKFVQCKKEILILG